jgi:hypothetical protein
MYKWATPKIFRKVVILTALAIALASLFFSGHVKAYLPCCSYCDGRYDHCVARCSSGDTACLNQCALNRQYCACNADPSCDCEPPGSGECSQSAKSTQLRLGLKAH